MHAFTPTEPWPFEAETCIQFCFVRSDGLATSWGQYVLYSRLVSSSTVHVVSKPRRLKRYHALHVKLHAAFLPSGTLRYSAASATSPTR